MRNYRLAWCAASEAASVRPGDWLSARELASLGALPFEKRRRDRLVGRVAAKRALREHFEAEWGWEAEPRELELFNDEAGRPFLELPSGSPASAPSFSISHSLWGGVCAVAAPGFSVGCDLEPVVPRPREVLAFVTAPREDAAGLFDPEGQARLWTGKEAVLKLLGLGLDADARMVELRDDGGVRLDGHPHARWTELGRPAIRVDFTSRDGSLAAVARTGG